MIYHFIKQIIKLSLGIYFKKIIVTGKENFPEKGPIILVANHPSTLIDPLIIASITKQQIGFIANAGIFSNKFLNAIFKYFHVIPIYRKKDIQPGEKPDNIKTFIKCHEYLAEGKTFVIFPEGSSYYELKLREIKTGTARIALSFEALNNFEGNLKILPIALDYSDAIQFRSKVLVTVNPPILVKAFEQTYLKDEFEAVTALTEAIRNELAKNIPHTSGKDQEDFLIKAHKFYAAYGNPLADLRLNPKESLALRNQVSKAFHFIYEHNAALYKDIEIKIQYYFAMLKDEKLSPGFFTNGFLNKNRVWVCLTYFLKFLLLLPFYLFGLMANYLPYMLPSKVFKALKIDIEYKTSVEMIAGLIIFPFFYVLEIWLFRKYISTDIWISTLLFAGFLLTGYIAMYYYAEIKRFSKVLYFYFFMNPLKKLKIIQLRDEILQFMEAARKSLT